MSGGECGPVDAAENNDWFGQTSQVRFGFVLKAMLKAERWMKVRSAGNSFFAVAPCSHLSFEALLMEIRFDDSIVRFSE